MVAGFELCDWLGRKGLQRLEPMNLGGKRLELRGLRITMTDARHSSSIVEDGRTLYLGEPAGFVVRLEDGVSLYYAGDTALFGDMRLIAEMHQPADAFLPIGDRFDDGTGSGCDRVPVAGVRQAIPMHWGNFPCAERRRPTRSRAALTSSGVQVVTLAPGETAE